MKTFSLVNAPHLPVTGASHPLVRESTRWLTTGNAIALLFAMLAFGGLYAWSQMNPPEGADVPVVVVDPWNIDPIPDFTRPVIREFKPSGGDSEKYGVVEPVPNDVKDEDRFGDPGPIPGELPPVVGEPFDLPDGPPVFVPTAVDTPFFAFDELPVLLSIDAPLYPELPRQAGIEGTVLVKVFVTRAGKVKQAVAMEGPDVFYDAAITAAKTALFAPAKQGDKPVDVWVMIPVTFTLHR